MATIETFWSVYSDCVADAQTCDVESSLGAYLGQPLRSQIDGALAEWAASRLHFIVEGQEIVHRRHDLALQDPETYEVDACIQRSSVDVFVVSDDGSRAPANDAVARLVVLQQFVLERTDDGEFVISTMQSSPDETPDGDTCDAYRTDDATSS